MTTAADVTGLATDALHLYGIKTAELTRLGGIDSTNFRVDTGAEFYVLHLYAARYNRAAIASELVWLDSLQRDVRLNVPEPVANRAGELVSSVRRGGAETLCTLMKWLEGRVPPTVDVMTVEQLEGTGALMAQLHTHSQGFRVPEGFSRPTYDGAYFRNCFGTLYRALCSTRLNQSDLEAFRADADTVLTRFESLEPVSSAFGLIHDDFHSGNYLLSGSMVSIIDFGRCGFGFYLHDLALALMELNETQRGNFLGGYKQVRPLPNGYTSLNETFLVLAYFDNLGTLASNPEEMDFIVNEMGFVAEACRRAASSP